MELLIQALTSVSRMILNSSQSCISHVMSISLGYSITFIQGNQGLNPLVAEFLFSFVETASSVLFRDGQE